MGERDPDQIDGDKTTERNGTDKSGYARVRRERTERGGGGHGTAKASQPYNWEGRDSWDPS